MRFSVFASALVAVVVGFGGTSAIIVAAARNLGGSPAEAGSWLGALCLGIGVVSIGMSVATRIPVVAAWSLAGAVLIAALPPGLAMPEATGAFIVCSVLITLSGLVPALGQAVERLPISIGAGMLAGLLLRFVAALFQAAQLEPLLVVPLLGVFLVGRRLHAASAPLLVIAAGLPLAWVLRHPLPAADFSLAVPIWTTPVFTWSALVGLGLPLFLVTMATQQVPGAAVLKAAGYHPPARLALVSTGLVSLLLSPFGGYAINLAALTAAICTGPDTHPDPARRWPAGVVYGALYLVLGLFGAGFGTMLAGLPAPLVSTVAGAALLGPMTNALTVSVAVERERFAAITAFCVTASGITILGLGGPFWGLLAGVGVLAFERIRLLPPPRGEGRGGGRRGTAP